MGRRFAVAIAVFLCVMASGCWDKVELEDRGFILSLGVDKFEGGKKNGTGGQDRYTVSIALPSIADMKEDALFDSANEVKSASGATIYGGIQSMNMGSSQKLYLGHTKMLVLGEGLLSDENLFRQAVDAMERNRDISRKLYMAATKTSAEGVLRVKMPGEPALALFVENFYENCGSPSFYKVLEKAVSDLRSTGCTVIPEIEPQAGKDSSGGRSSGDESSGDESSGDKSNDDKSSGDESSGDESTGGEPSGDESISDESGGDEKDGNKPESGGAKPGEDATEKPKGVLLGGCAVIKGYKLAGWLDELEMRGYAWVAGGCRDTVVTIRQGSVYLPLRVSNSRPRVDFFEADGKLGCRVGVKASGGISEYDFGAADLNDPEVLKVCRAAFEKEVAGEILSTAKRAQGIGADIYNFKGLLKKNDYQLYLKYCGGWEGRFREMEIIPEVKVDIISVGTIK